MGLVRFLERLVADDDVSTCARRMCDCVLCPDRHPLSAPLRIDVGSLFFVSISFVTGLRSPLGAEYNRLFTLVHSII